MSENVPPNNGPSQTGGGQPGAQSGQPGSQSGQPGAQSGPPPNWQQQPQGQGAPQPPYGYPTGPQEPAKKKAGCFKIGCIGLVAIVVLGGIIAAIAAAMGGGTPQSGGPAGPGGGGASSAPAAVVGAPVRSGDVEFTITAYKCGVTVKDVAEQTVTPQGQFCQVDVSIKNVGSEQVTVNQDDIKIVDAAGTEFSTSSDTLLVDNTIFLKQINPGNSIKGTAYFDIPKEASPVTATVQGGFLESPVEIALA